MGEVRIVGNFPEKPVRVGEVSGVPIELRPRPTHLHDSPPAGLNLGQKVVNLLG
jgi:hypothetical protein